MIRLHSPTMILTLAIALGAPLPAAAAKVAARPTPKAGTGDVTRAQLIAQSNKTFDLADANHDGFMSRAEFAARMAIVINSSHVQSRAEAQQMVDAANRAFDDVDLNHDGKLSRTEATARPLKAFAMMDANHDGILTVAEKRAAHQNAPVLQAGPVQDGPGQ